MKKLLTLTTTLVTIATSASYAMEATPEKNDTLTRNKFFTVCAQTNARNPISVRLMQEYFPLVQRKYRVLLSLEQSGLLKSANGIAVALCKYARSSSCLTDLDDRTAKDLLVELFVQEGKPELAKALKIPSLHFENGEKEGFDFKQYKVFVNFGKYHADGVMKEPVCGYDMEAKKIVPKYITVQHTIFRSFITAGNNIEKYLIQPKENKIAEVLYGNSEIHKSLWKSSDSFATPEDNLLAISGALCSGDTIDYSPYSEQLFDYHEYLLSPGKGKFIPRVFSITYKEYQQILEKNPKVDLLLEGIEKTINPSIKFYEERLSRLSVPLQDKIIVKNED